jgi:hypothetical protein
MTNNSEVYLRIKKNIDEPKVNDSKNSEENELLTAKCDGEFDNKILSHIVIVVTLLWFLKIFYKI